MELFRVLESALGTKLTLTLMGVLIAGLIGRRVYNDWQANRHMDAALKEKERTIQRLASREREWRALFLKKFADLDDDEVKAIISGDYDTPEESRNAVESGNDREQNRPPEGI